MTEKQFNGAVLENLKTIRKNIADAAQRSGRNAQDIKLMAVTKTVDAETVNVVLNDGVDLIGENRVQEYLDKRDLYFPKPKTHFIGHLQTNKVKYIIDKVDMIQSVDSLKLAGEISRCAGKINRNMDVLVEINIGEEESKSGIAPLYAVELVEEISKLPNITVRGIMSIPPVCEKKEDSLRYFSALRQIFIDIGSKNIDNVYMEELSMGMSQDYEAAVEMGATIVRIGSALFGARNYNK